MDTCCSCTVRRIGPGDAGALSAFYNGMGRDALRRFRPLGWETTVEACEKVIEGNAAKPEKRFDLVALRDGAIVGWGFLWDLDTEKPSFGLGIAAASRGKGLGGSLMDQVLQEARRRGLRRVDLTVVTDNEVARQLYEKRGFATYDEYVDEKDGLPYFRMMWNPAPRP